MRQLLLPLALVSVVACSSKPKTDTPAAPAVPPTTATGKVEAKVSAVAKEATKNAMSTTAKVECTLKTDTRILEVRAKDKGCELAYTKGGKEEIKASSVKGLSHCQHVLAKMQDHLAKANYACK